MSGVLEVEPGRHHREHPRCGDLNQVLQGQAKHLVDKGSLLRSKFQRVRHEYSGLYFLPAEIHARDNPGENLCTRCDPDSGRRLAAFISANPRMFSGRYFMTTFRA